MSDLVICELCGKSFYSKNDSEICCASSSSAASSRDKEIIKQRRAAAKSLGAKALKGSVKQKKWAEDIRKSFIAGVSQEALSSFVNSETLLQAKFWIENRENNNLISDIESLISLTKKMNDGDKTAETSAQRAAVILKLKIS